MSWYKDTYNQNLVHQHKIQDSNLHHLDNLSICHLQSMNILLECKLGDYHLQQYLNSRFELNFHTQTSLLYRFRIGYVIHNSIRRHQQDSQEVDNQKKNNRIDMSLECMYFQ